MKTFKDLGLNDKIISVLERIKIVSPTEIQEKAIPSVLRGEDIIGISATGSGKTLVYSSAIIEKVEENAEIQALVLTPTRELAEQVASEIRKFSIKTFRVFAAYGGVKIDEQMKKIQGSDILIATPGRLIDLMERSVVSLKKVQILVLDEFDRMLDMGFERDVTKIVYACPKERQTMLFSATMSQKIEHLIKEFTKNSKKIEVGNFLDPSKLEQVYYKCDSSMKLGLLIHLLVNDKPNSAIVFCSTRLSTELIARNLYKKGIDTKIIHGGLEQKKRMNVLKAFHKEGGILVCTDVAARGLDIKDVENIYNYDLPKKPEDYIHRIGRTARAGKTGKATTILSPRDHEIFEQILNLGVKIDEMESIKVEKIQIELDMKKLKKGSKPRKKTQDKWVSIDDPALSNRFKKKTVEQDYDEEDYETKKKARGAGKKKKKIKIVKKVKKGKEITTYKPRKGKSKKIGRAGTKYKTKKINRRPKGRANRKTKK